MIDGFLRNTVVPDKIYLSLSVEEFPNKEHDLPGELMNVVRLSDGTVQLNWVDGPNMKPWKKVFPVLKFLEDNDLIILADDDLDV